MVGPITVPVTDRHPGAASRTPVRLCVNGGMEIVVIVQVSDGLASQLLPYKLLPNLYSPLPREDCGQLLLSVDLKSCGRFHLLAQLDANRHPFQTSWISQNRSKPRGFAQLHVEGGGVGTNEVPQSRLARSRVRK